MSLAEMNYAFGCDFQRALLYSNSTPSNALCPSLAAFACQRLARAFVRVSRVQTLAPKPNFNRPPLK